jgi:hypothetical protein
MFCNTRDIDPLVRWRLRRSTVKRQISTLQLRLHGQASEGGHVYLDYNNANF